MSLDGSIKLENCYHSEVFVFMFSITYICCLIYVPQLLHCNGETLNKLQKCSVINVKGVTILRNDAHYTYTLYNTCISNIKIMCYILTYEIVLYFHFINNACSLYIYSICTVGLVYIGLCFPRYRYSPVGEYCNDQTAVALWEERAGCTL